MPHLLPCEGMQSRQICVQLGPPGSTETGTSPPAFPAMRTASLFRRTSPPRARTGSPSHNHRALRTRVTGCCRLARLIALCSLVILVGATTEAFAKPKVHTVYAGQRLGSIAKRYNVTVEELCKANGISSRAPIKPGQKLIIPGTDDGKGDGESKSQKSQEKSAPSQKSSDTNREDGSQKPAGPAKVHVVAKGHTLAAISGRYAVTIGAICNANGIERTASLSVGQKLIIPHKTDKDGSYARKQRLRGHFDEETRAKKDENHKDDGKGSSGNGGETTWQKYVKPAWKSGYIEIFRYQRSWKGYVIGPTNEVLGHASNKINYVMGAKADGPRIDPKLIRLIASISDKFGGRPMRIVSGYRTKSFVAASKHKEGKAIDFSIPGVPNEALRDYLRTIKGVGVGYYPNSSFVHLDVRGYNSYWIDYAGPGEAPRKGPQKGTSGKKSPASEEPEDDEEFDPAEEQTDDAALPESDAEEPAEVPDDKKEPPSGT